jgi:competence protein ComEA
MKAKKKIVGSIVVLLVLVVFLVVGLVRNREKPHKFNEDDIFVESITNESDNNSGNKMVTVYINGEVKKPGVYKLKSGSIVDDLIKASGGLTENANTESRLNLARKLKDEDNIFIEKKVERLLGSEQVKAGSQKANNEGILDLNSATLEELDKLPDIGPVTAQKIIDYREKNGTFNSIDDLKKVGGIGDKTIDKFRDKVDIR